MFHVSSLSSVPGIPDKMITNVSKVSTKVTHLCIDSCICMYVCMQVMTFVSKQIFDSRGSHDQQLISLMNKVLQVSI